MPDTPIGPDYIIPEDYIIRDLASLRIRYGEVSAPALAKEVDYLHPHYQAFIRAAPFVVLATVGPGSPEVTPRGDAAGFVAIDDEKTLLLPDRRGNNRIDNLRNIVGDPRVSLLFLVPGVGETLRVNGTAEISVDPALLARFEVNGKLPATVLVIRVKTVFFQCAKALVRSKLWDPETRIARSALPSNGTILAALTQAKIGGAAYDAAAPERLRATLY
jgi:PPOX class probable FMN-dependent enzyme